MTNIAKIVSDDILNRQFIGYHQILNDWSANISKSNYPPYNVIDISEDEVVIELAIAGFAPEEVSVTVENGVLVIAGEKAEDDDREIRYQDISARKLYRDFKLAEYWEVADATYKHGILAVTLKLEIPEARKPKQIEIETL